MSVIKTNNLTYTYPNKETPSLRDVSIDIEKGEFVLITGPSGCGKTTLCRCLNGLIPHFYQGEQKGEVIISGLKVKEHPIHELAKHVGLVFQNPENQLFALSVEKDVAFGLENLGVSREKMYKRVDRALNLTGISDLRERPPHELSGGQQQRVAIASVLAMQPEVIVLDEPTSFLDPLGAKNIFQVISDLNRNLGVTVILVEHRLDLTARYANHIIVMDNGEVILDGDPRKILSSEQARLIGVGIPKSTRLYSILQEELDLPSSPPLCSEEMVTMLKEVFESDD